uniref:J domain-containing protein n=1 Tax=Cryptomonas curvata TaxID=233186 RepID=A0A7S0M9T1_9CRYP|mmetsp:Transcript_2855/g.6169  ORF Transcript_2855/g.6169 Transcript_2855/m.6169 type:complete len:212 (+) Transcript_2855:1-636(+)
MHPTLSKSLRYSRRLSSHVSFSKNFFLRGYKNIWGGGSDTNEVVRCEAPRQEHKVATTESWKLDWEEDGRWVEWRLDKDAQAEGDLRRVQLEWKRFRGERGRTRVYESEDDTFGRHGGFQRGTESWWRQQHYNYEFVGSNGVLSMEAVQLALKTLKVTDAGDASAIRGAYLRMVSQWHPDRFQKEEERKTAAEMFRNVTDAYNLLKELRER